MRSIEEITAELAHVKELLIQSTVVSIGGPTSGDINRRNALYTRVEVLRRERDEVARRGLVRDGLARDDQVDAIAYSMKCAGVELKLDPRLAQADAEQSFAELEKELG
jgi:hypothetical protein